MENGDFLMFFISFVVSISFITMLAACLCCRKKMPKNELLGLEGMVKIKNPDEHLVNGSAVISSEPNPKNSGSEPDPKRTSNAPHRSLPDIPISDPNQLDTGSDLYATVGDKVTGKPHGRSPTSSLKKQVSVSQHSSISQADDLSSPYARVRSPLHAYDKVRPAEHPYAQLKLSGTSNNSNATHCNPSTSNNNYDGSLLEENSLSRRGSHQSLLDAVDGHQQQVIPAASAIAGRVSASQELPYMTPPIVQPQQHFSGDSQDSSKGYTSISVREPLANIIAQTKKQNAQARRRDIADSHYATVSDDSDEMYAAIDDPNNQADLYTSGSETYAQIQPHIVPLTVAVEINTASNIIQANGDHNAQPETPPLSTIPHSNHSMVNGMTISTVSSPRHSVIANVYLDDQPPLPPVEILKAAHSRQASSSSCTSSVGNLGSPKPEKRQANSPLPPTPKIPQQYLSNSNLTSSSSAPSGRNSAASVIDCHVLNITSGGAGNVRQISRENLCGNDMAGRSVNTSVIRLTDKSSASGGNGGSGIDGDEPRKKNRMSKDLEGMYAKVMKKTKLSNAPSQNTSPIPYRKSLNDKDSSGGLFLSDPDISREQLMPDMLSKSVHASPGKSSVRSAHATVDNDYETIDKRRARGSNFHYDQKDPGYETIPADKLDKTILTKSMKLSRASAPPGALQHVDQNTTSIPLNSFPETDKYSDNYMTNSEPGYESLTDQSMLTNDPGYETVNPDNSRKSNSDYDPNYEVLRPMDGDRSSGHYAKVWDNKSKIDANDGYSSIKSPKKSQANITKLLSATAAAAAAPSTCSDEDVPGYCTISSDTKTGYNTKSNVHHHDYASISESTKRNYFKSSTVITDEDVYSSIPSESSAVIVVSGSGNGNNGNGGQTTSHTLPLSPSTVTSPTSNIMQISGYSTISDTKTITSLSSSDCSSDTQIDYNRVRSANDISQMTQSTYESLTGSESDPNYESVRYLNVKDKENPYERLHNEKGSSPEPTTKNSTGNGSSSGGGGGIDSGSATEKNSSTSSILTNNDSSDATDYFQV